MAKSIEDLSVDKIKSGIRAIKTGSKTPEEASLGYSFNKLQELNEGLYQDFLAEYVEAVKNLKK